MYCKSKKIQYYFIKCSNTRCIFHLLTVTEYFIDPEIGQHVCADGPLSLFSIDLGQIEFIIKTVMFVNYK